ncbi:MAG: ribonuclease III [Anaerolineae bacterium]
MTDAQADVVPGLEAAWGVRFNDHDLALTALTHRSYLNEVAEPDTGDNERMEFLGDALLDFVAGRYLYEQLPAAREGELTALRAALVCEGALAGYARQLGLGQYLRLGRGENSSGGRDRSAILCNAFEALVGALYLDAGMAVVEAFVLDYLAPELTAVLAEQHVKDAKSRFQEFAQRRWQVTPEYRTVSESGPDHEKWFVVAVALDDEVWGVGEGRSKTAAAREAAGAALEKVDAGSPAATDGDAY